MIKKWFWSAAWTLVLAAALQGQSRQSVLMALSEAPEWSAVDQPTEYDETNIEALAGDRAPSIQKYGLIGAARQTWKGPAGNVRLTLVEMIDASAAYGVFSQDRNIDQAAYQPIPLGSEGYRTGNRSVFWQSKYVVQLEGSTEATDGFGRLVSDNIFGRSRKPPVSSHLPPANLVAGSEKYVIDASGIGREFNLDPEMLGFDDSVEVATATYRVDGKTARLALMLYPTRQVAKKYADRWDATAPEESAFRKRVGPLLALVRSSRDPAVASAVLDAVNYESQVTWNEPRPDISISDVILTIFTFIGIALLFTLVAGLSFGGLRIFVKARYPNRVFDTSDAMEIIQLKLDQGVMRKELTE
jgi:hypothetical protein